MKFGKELEAKIKPEWRQFYIDYRGLKELIEESAREAESQGQMSFSPRTTSLSVIKTSTTPEQAHERFFVKLDQEFNKIARFTQHKVEELRAALTAQSRKAAVATDEAEKEQLLQASGRADQSPWMPLEYGFHSLYDFGAHLPLIASVTNVSYIS